MIPGTEGEQVFAVVFDADGSLLALGGESGTVQLWDVADARRPRLRATLRPSFQGAVEALALSPDGHTLVAGSLGHVPVLRWDVSDPAHPVELPDLPGQTAGDTVKALAFDRSGDDLAAAGSGGGIELWTLSGSTVRATRRWTAPGSAGVYALAFDPTRPLLLTGDNLGRVEVWSSHPPTAGVRPLRVLSGKTNSQVNALAFSSDGSLLAAGSSDSDLRQWQTSGWSVHSDTSNPGPVTGVDYVPGGRVATTAADGALRLQSTAEQQLPTTGSTFALVWSRTGRRLLVATNGTHGGEQLWDLARPGSPRRLGPLMTLPAPYTIAGSGAMTPDGDLVAGGNAQGQVELWNTTDPLHPQVTTKPFRADGGLVESLAFTPNGRVLVVAGDDNDVHLWDVADPAHPRELATMKEHSLVLQVAVSRNGRELAAGNADDAAYLYRITDPSRPTLQARITGPHNYVWGVGFSPDGRRLAAADADDTTRVYDITDPTHPRRLGRPLIGPSDYDYGAVFTPDGSRVAVASNDGTVRTYLGDGTDRIPRQTLTSAGGPVFIASYDPSGGLLAAGGRQNGVTIWSTRVRPYERRLCRDAGTPITRAEWALYVPDEPYSPPCR
ncbi:MAG: WD40 repeat domain-containing protein [Jatrophihabitans endophyticus]|nr:WD40 repeat domain-containing protein [Jatrophihabitans endophyticus]